jgi:transposase
LHAPIVLIWDNLNTHVSKRMREFIDAHTDWLTVIRLPAYAAELNAVESVWSHLKHGLGNCAATSIDEPVAIVKSRLKQLQYRPDLLDGFLGQTRLPLQPGQT